MANRAKKVIEVNVNGNKTANKINTHMKMREGNVKRGKRKLRNVENRPQYVERGQKCKILAN